MDIRLIAMDLDGTLLSDGQAIPEENVAALAECARRGIHLAIASGRSFASARMFARRMDLNCAILSCNGARVDLTPFGPVAWERVMPADESALVHRSLAALGAPFMCYAGSRIYVHNGAALGRRAHAPGVQWIDGYSQEYIYDEARLLAEGVPNAYKYVAFSDDAQLMARVRGALAGLPVNVASSWWDNLEIMGQGVNKGAALAALAERLGVRREQVMAFGDQLNDREMLTFAGLPVAMGNAIDELKAIAAVVAAPCHEGGVGRAIERYALGGERL
ncbi:MAG: HAD family phosphatase [Clostridiales bacterium]|nr:HAD family phosphatase [Clostridiales bacterium]